MPADDLRFEGLVRGFAGLPVLQGISGAARPGEVLLVTGRNGSGKSTLLRLLAGLLAPEAGVIEVRRTGRVQSIWERRRGVGYLAPDLALYGELTVAENLTLFRRLRRLQGRAGADDCERFDLPLHRAAGALSSGMRQRLRWVWTLLHAPKLLLLDEPFTNLDSDGEATARALLEARLDEGAMAVVASPVPLELSRVATRLDLAG